MARRSIGSLPFCLAALVSLAGLGACTSILGDFTLKPGDAGTVGDSGPLVDAALDVLDATDAPSGDNVHLVDAIDIAAGDRHTCALRRDRNVFCWGDNSKGQLGTSSPGGDKKPLRVANLSNVHAIVAGANHTCALVIAGNFAQGGQVVCWGDNTNGKLGDASFLQSQSNVPVQVRTGGAGSPVLNKVGNLAAGRDHTCAAGDGGSVLCWGSNLSGQLGNPPSGGDHATPAAPNPTQATRSLGGGAGFTCSVGSVGATVSTVCWGTNDNGQLGLGAGAPGAYHAPSPVQYPAASSTIAKHLVATGLTHACSVDDNQGLECWGSNEWGESGPGVPPGAGVKVEAPARVPGRDYLAIAAGEQVTCGITKINLVACSGRNDFGQLGIGSVSTGAQPNPVTVKDLTGVGALSVGTRHACAIARALLRTPAKEDTAPGGPVYCWGSGGDNRLGNGAVDLSASPVQVLKPDI